MNNHLHWTKGHVLFVLLLLGALFIDAMEVVVAEKVATTLTVEQTVKNARDNCSDLNGTFTTGGWTTPGDKPGTMVSTTYTTCDYGGGDVSTCYHTPGAVDCRAKVTVPPEERDQVPSQEDTLLGAADLTPAPVTPEPTVLPSTRP